MWPIFYTCAEFQIAGIALWVSRAKYAKHCFAHGERPVTDGTCVIKRKAGIAQLVEQRIRNAKVGGSTPLSGTIL